jgi:hypothetical protein
MYLWNIPLYVCTCVFFGDNVDIYDHRCPDETGSKSLVNYIHKLTYLKSYTVGLALFLFNLETLHKLTESEWETTKVFKNVVYLKHITKRN